MLSTELGYCLSHSLISRILREPLPRVGAGDTVMNAVRALQSLRTGKTDAKHCGQRAAATLCNTEMVRDQPGCCGSTGRDVSPSPRDGACQTQPVWAGDAGALSPRAVPAVLVTGN